MIDTIVATTNYYAGKFDTERQESLLPDWIGRNSQIGPREASVGKFLPSDLPVHVFVHKSGIRVEIRGYYLEKISLSLPRQTYGGNGVHLKAPRELREALNRMLQILFPIAPRLRLDHLRVTRLDLALNLPFDPRMTLALHRHATHPRIRRETEEYRNPAPGTGNNHLHDISQLNTVRLNGKQTTIQLYDKLAEMRAKRRNIESIESSRSIRVEIQLRGRGHIADLFNITDEKWMRMDQLKFGDAYRVFRQLILQFDNVGSEPQFKATLPALLAILDLFPGANGFLGGLDPLEWYRVSNAVSDRQFRAMRRDVFAFQRRFRRFRWADHLPADRLPDIVDICPDGTQALVPSPCRVFN